MFDFKFNWYKSIEIGISAIDEQHKELFKIGRNIEQLLLTKSKGIDDDKLAYIVCSLRDYVTYHFYYEETFLLHINYPHLTAHKKSHDKFKAIISSIDYDNLEESLNALQEMIILWVFEHILVEDHEIKIFLNS